jgi:hypothetical protein
MDKKKKIDQPKIEPQKCKHNIIIFQCAVCQKEIETAIKYILRSFYKKRPTLRELCSAIEQVAAKNPELFGPNNNENAHHVS